GRERRRSKVPWTRSLLIASKVTTTAKIGMTNVANPAAMIKRTKSGPTVKNGEGSGLEVKTARVWFSPATSIVTLEGPRGSSSRPYPRESTSLTYVSLSHRRAATGTPARPRTWTPRSLGTESVSNASCRVSTVKFSTGLSKNTPEPDSAFPVRTVMPMELRFPTARRANPSASADVVPSGAGGWTERSVEETVAPGKGTPKGSETRATPGPSYATPFREGEEQVFQGAFRRLQFLEPRAGQDERLAHVRAHVGPRLNRDVQAIRGPGRTGDARDGGDRRDRFIRDPLGGHTEDDRRSRRHLRGEVRDRIGRDDPTAVDDADMLAKLLDLGEEVRGKEDGLAFPVEESDEVAEVAHPLRIEAARRLVHDEQLGIVEQGLGEGEALFHPVTVGLHLLAGDIADPHLAEEVDGPTFRGGPRDPVERR